MNTIILPTVFENIIIITIIIYCEKKKGGGTEEVSRLPHCAVYTCTIFFRYTNSFQKLLLSLCSVFLCSSTEGATVTERTLFKQERGDVLY